MKRKELLLWGDDVIPSTAPNAVQVFPQAHLHKVISGPLPGIQTAPHPIIQFPGPHGVFEGNLVGIGMAVCGVLGEHVPYGDEEFAGDGDGRFIGTKTRLEPLVLGFPVRVRVCGTASSFDQDPTYLFAATFRDSAGAVLEAAIVDTGSQAGIAHQIFGVREAGDVPDGSQHGHGDDEAEARQLQEEGHLFSPGLGVAQASELFVDLTQLLLDVIDGGQVVAEAHAFCR